MYEINEFRNLSIITNWELGIGVIRPLISVLFS